MPALKTFITNLVLSASSVNSRYKSYETSRTSPSLFMKQVSKHTILRMLVSEPHELKDMNCHFEHFINSIEYSSTYLPTYLSFLVFCAMTECQSDKELTKEG